MGPRSQRVRGEDVHVTSEHGFSYPGRETRGESTEGALVGVMLIVLTRRWAQSAWRTVVALMRVAASSGCRLGAQGVLAGNAGSESAFPQSGARQRASEVSLHRSRLPQPNGAGGRRLTALPLRNCHAALDAAS